VDCPLLPGLVSGDGSTQLLTLFRHAHSLWPSHCCPVLAALLLAKPPLCKAGHVRHRTTAGHHPLMPLLVAATSLPPASSCHLVQQHPAEGIRGIQHAAPWLRESARAPSWHLHGTFMAPSWHLHGTFMATSWQLHGTFMAYSSLLPPSTRRKQARSCAGLSTGARGTSFSAGVGSGTSWHAQFLSEAPDVVTLFQTHPPRHLH
jgi:hypothetical protein